MPSAAPILCRTREGRAAAPPPCPRSRSIEDRKGSPIGGLAVERELHVAGAVEFFEDDLIHVTPGINPCGRIRRDAAALSDLRRGAPLGDRSDASHKKSPRRSGVGCGPARPMLVATLLVNRLGEGAPLSVHSAVGVSGVCGFCH